MRRLLWLLVAVFLVETAAADPRRHLARLERVRRDEVRLLSEGRLKDGTRIERIEELAKDLPPLPVEEEVDSLNDEKVGRLEQGEFLIPVDDQGRILKGYEHLLRPIVLEVDVDDIQGQLPDSEQVNIRFGDGAVIKTASGQADGGDYEEPEDSDPFRIPPLPDLPVRDYDASQEAPKDDEDGNEEQEKELENVLAPAKNELGDPIPLVPEEEEGKEVEVGSASSSSSSSSEESSEAGTEEKDLTEEEIAELAKQLAEQLSGKLLGQGAEPEETPEKEAPEGHILETPILNEQELEQLKRDSAKKPGAEETAKVRGARIQMPDGAPSVQFIFAIVALFVIWA